MAICDGQNGKLEKSQILKKFQHRRSPKFPQNFFLFERALNQPKKVIERIFSLGAYLFINFFDYSSKLENRVLKSSFLRQFFDLFLALEAAEVRKSVQSVY